MAKILECAKVDPSSGCKQVIRGETTEEVMQKAAEHAKEADKVIRDHPYPSMGIAFGVGILIGVLVSRR